MAVRPLFARVIVFHLSNRRRFKSGLFSGNTVKDTLFGPQWVYVYGAAEKCHYDYKPCAKVLLEDGMALLDADLDLYDEIKDDPKFAALRQAVDEAEADVVTKAILEGAIIAADEDSVKLKSKYAESPSPDVPHPLCGSV